MDTLLVHGFVRGIERLLENRSIIPLDIYHICFDFYFATKFIFYLAALRGDNKGDDIMCTANIDNKNRWKIEIHELNDVKTAITINDANEKKWCMDCAGINFVRNINLPKMIQHQLPNQSGSNYKFNNIIFRCGGLNKHYKRTNYCAALIINSHDFDNQQKKTITAYNWEIPSFPFKIQSNFVFYSYNKAALLSVGGYGSGTVDNIYSLPFNNDWYLEQNLNEWKWNKLKTNIPTPRYSPCCAMINNSTKLIVIGGSNGNDLNKVELLNMDKNTWIDVKDRKESAMDSGIYYDDMNEMVYVGGGYSESVEGAVKFVECYNLEKNVWNKLPNTQKGHDMNPLIWIEDNLLHIMSVAANGIERMDLREAKVWTTTYNDLSALFHTKFDSDDVSVSRLVGN